MEEGEGLVSRLLLVAWARVPHESCGTVIYDLMSKGRRGFFTLVLASFFWYK